MENTFVYVYQGGLYVNLTNRCTNACTFCIRNAKDGVGGEDLWLAHEPSAAEVIDAIKKHHGYEKLTFCGFGEPTIRIDILADVATAAKDLGLSIKVNTNGQGSLFHGRDILPELKGKVDAFSISLNAPDAKTYQALCQSQYGEAAYAAVLDFSKKSVQYQFNTTLTVLDILGQQEIAACQKIAENMGADFRIRHKA